jgi:hypothetical protein
MLHIIGLPSLLLWVSAAVAPEQRAADYLAREVPKWARENGCYSCHNNGDGARALFAARRAGLSVPDAALAGTVEWLREPAKWSESHGNPGVTNIKLANIQFAAALLDAGLSDRKPLAGAADALLRLQDADGSWKVDAGGIPGAPATYGVALATYMARRVLTAAGSTAAAERATVWLRDAKPGNVVDAAGIALALPERRDAIAFLERAQNRDGGWGETFDTAIAILALDRARETAAVERGRAALLRLQQPAGGWQETTRPPGGVSYAEHISTTAWALYTLLETDSKRK